MKERPVWLRATIDSVHSLSAGLAPGSALALWMIRGGAEANLTAAQFEELTRTWTPVLLVPLIALLLLVVSGMARLGHHNLNIEPSAVAARGRATAAKHALFVVVFCAAVIWMFMLVQP
jgi:hypothetical protein